MPRIVSLTYLAEGVPDADWAARLGDAAFARQITAAGYAVAQVAGCDTPRGGAAEPFWIKSGGGRQRADRRPGKLIITIPAPDTG